MKTKLCPNCRKNVDIVNEKCPICGFDLTKELSDEQIHQEKIKQGLKPSDNSNSSDCKK